MECKKEEEEEEVQNEEREIEKLSPLAFLGVEMVCRRDNRRSSNKWISSSKTTTKHCQLAWRERTVFSNESSVRISLSVVWKSLTLRGEKLG